MRIGIHAVRYDTPGGTASIAPTLAATARAAEDAGVSRFTLMDHWFQMEHMAPASDPMLEGYTTLGFVAAHTQSMRLGLLVPVSLAIPGCWPRSSPRSMSCPVAGRTSASAPGGTSASTAPSACRSRP
jgi:hypothetical protein